MFTMKETEVQIDDFILYCETKGLSKKTISSYEQTLKLFAKYVFDTYQITDSKDIKEITIRQYIKYLQERGKYTIVFDDTTLLLNNPSARKDFNKRISATTINNYIRNIKVFFSYLKEERLIKSNPMEKIKQLKNERKAESFIGDAEFINLLKHIDTSKFHEYRDYIIIQLLLDTGMRIGECLLITNDDVDLEKRCIMLPAENTKGKKSRYVFFSQYMQKELRRWIQYKDRYKTSEYIFCTIKATPLEVRNFERNFRVYAGRVGINEAHPHQLRNNFAKRFLMSGGDIYTLSRLLGHSSVTVTEKACLDLTDSDIRKNYQKFSPLANLKSRNKK